MSKKIYEAPNTIISNITLIVAGKPKRISFYPITQYEGSHTGNGSMFVTEDKDMQDALEGSPMFNRSFFLFSETVTETVAVDKPQQMVEENAQSESSDEVVPVSKVATLNDARDYLETRFGIEKSKLPTTKSILNAAAKNGIKFEAFK